MYTFFLQFLYIPIALWLAIVVNTRFEGVALGLSLLKKDEKHWWNMWFVHGWKQIGVKPVRFNLNNKLSSPMIYKDHR